MLQVMSEYWGDNNNGVRAEVIFNGKEFGCRFYNQGTFIKEEYYTGHSEAYAESAAENYCQGIKQL